MTKNKVKEITKVLLDCKNPAAKEVEFSKEHTENLFKLQDKKGYDHWKLSEGQGLIYKDGKITHKGSDTGTN